MNDFIIKNTSDKGKGLFSTVHFDKNQILFKFIGNAQEYIKPPPDPNLLQIGTNLYLDIGKHFSLFVNHHCIPNCYVSISVNTAFILSSREINPGDEITFDYSTTSTENPDTWSMICNCSQFYCRKIISGFYNLPQAKQNELIISGKVPKYVYMK